MNFPMHKTKAFSAPDDEDKIAWVQKVKSGIQIHPGYKCMQQQTLSLSHIPVI